MTVSASDRQLAPIATTASTWSGRRKLRRRLSFVRNYSSWRRAVRELWRFKWRENRRMRVVGAYHTRGYGLPYFVRHTTPDVAVFHELFVAGEYEPPPEVEERLRALGRPPLVLDLGGNVGLFATFARERWPGAQVVSVEPDPDNLEVLRRTAAGREDLEVIEACAAGHDGTLRFAAGGFARSHVVDADSAEGDVADAIEVASVDIFRLAGSADLVKMDIEGSEWNVLEDPRLAAVPATAWAMEWHTHLCPHPNPGAAAREALEAAGFSVVSERSPLPFNDIGTIWGVRRS